MSETNTTQPGGWTYGNDKDNDLWRWKPGSEQLRMSYGWDGITPPASDAQSFLCDLTLDPRPRDEEGRLVEGDHIAHARKMVPDVATDQIVRQAEEIERLKARLVEVGRERDEARNELQDRTERFNSVADVSMKDGMQLAEKLDLLTFQRDALAARVKVLEGECNAAVAAMGIDLSHTKDDYKALLQKSGALYREVCAWRALGLGGASKMQDDTEAVRALIDARRETNQFYKISAQATWKPVNAALAGKGDECDGNTFYSGVCNRGTKGCQVKHPARKGEP